LVSALLPAALNTFTPVGSTVGNLVGSFLPGMTGGVTDFLGNALVGAGVGALTNSKDRGQGALYGALGGGFGPMLASGLGLQGVGTTGALGNLMGMFGGGAGAAGGMAANGLPVNGPGMLPPVRPPGIGSLVSGAAQQGASGGLSDFVKNAIPALALAGAFSGAGGKQQQQAAPPGDPRMPQDQRGLTDVDFNRTINMARRPVKNPLRYGMDPDSVEYQFFADKDGENKLPSTAKAASGGYVTERGVLTRMAEGGMAGHGRSDHIEALLSPGEYVIDAESVSMLGNGSSEAGAGMLDRFREQLRKHKADGLSQGRMSADSMQPERYMKGR
jgi:hypothetical protein